MAPESRLIPLKDAQAWEQALAGLPQYFVYSHAYNAAMHASSDMDTYLYVCEMNTGRIICPLSMRDMDGKVDAVSPYGFGGFLHAGDVAGFPEAFHAFMEKEGIVAGYIVQHPLVKASALTLPLERGEGKHCFLMDLTKNEDQLLADMASDHRSRMRQWLKQAWTVSADKQILLAPFLSMYPEAMSRAGAGTSYQFGERALSMLAEMNECVLVGAANTAGEMEAVSLFLSCGEYAEYYLNACTETGKRHARGLIWEAIKILKTKGVKTLNLGCGIREGDALEEFKRRFGGLPKRFSMYKQIYLPDTYALLCRQHGACTADRSGYFPAYRMPQLFDKLPQTA